jgi:hypothetical protein
MVDWRSLRLSVEMLLLFVAGPVVLYYLVYIPGKPWVPYVDQIADFSDRIPLFKLLPWVFGIFAVLLVLERDRSWIRAFTTLPRFRHVLYILLSFIVLGGALTWYAYTYYPARFLAFPRGNYELWLQVMMLYPAISVVTQEIIYRVFYFHRYAPLLENRPILEIILSAALFSFAHLMLFGIRQDPIHWQSIAISFAGGLLFSYRYYTTKSFWAVALEHSLYGNLIYTVGLGLFFYTGVSNF